MTMVSSSEECMYKNAAFFFFLLLLFLEVTTLSGNNARGLLESRAKAGNFFSSLSALCTVARKKINCSICIKTTLAFHVTMSDLSDTCLDESRSPI